MEELFVQLSEEESSTFFLELENKSRKNLKIIVNSIEFGIFMNWLLKYINHYSSLEMIVFGFLYYCLPMMGDDCTVLVLMKESIVNIIESLEKEDSEENKIKYKMNEEQLKRRELLIMYFFWKLNLPVISNEKVINIVMKKTKEILKWVNKTQRLKINIEKEENEIKIMEEERIIKAEGYDSFFSDFLQIIFEKGNFICVTTCQKENIKLLFYSINEILNENLNIIDEILEEENIEKIKGLLSYNNDNSYEYSSSSYSSSSTASSSPSFILPFSLLSLIKSLTSYLSFVAVNGRNLKFLFLPLFNISVSLIHSLISLEEIIGFGKIKLRKKENEYENEEEKERIICRRIILHSLIDNRILMQDFIMSFRSFILSLCYYYRYVKDIGILKSILSIFIHVVFLPLNFPFSDNLYFDVLHDDDDFTRDNSKYNCEYRSFLFNSSTRFDLLKCCIDNYLFNKYHFDINLIGFYLKRNEEKWNVRFKRMKDEKEELKEEVIDYKNVKFFDSDNYSDSYYNYYNYKGRKFEFLNKEEKIYYLNSIDGSGGDIFSFICLLLCGEVIILDRVEREKKDKRKKEVKETKNNDEKKTIKKMKTSETSSVISKYILRFVKLIRMNLFEYKDDTDCHSRDLWIKKHEKNDEYNRLCDVYEEEDAEEIINLYEYKGLGRDSDDDIVD